MGNAIYILSKIDGKKYCKTNGQFSRHLKQNNLTYQEYYEQYVTGIKMLCKCGSSLTFYQASETYANSCGDVTCVGRLIRQTKANWSNEQRLSDSVNKKTRAATRTEEEKNISRETRKQTNRKKYGVDFTTQSSQMITKSKLTKKTRYGHEYYSNPKKTSDSWQAKTPEEIAAITEKKRNTCVERYGVETPFFLPDVRQKSAIANSIGREMVLPSGRVVRVRGYEDTAISKLLEIYTEADLLFDDLLQNYNIPVFTYSDGMKHKIRYYPDIFLQKENKIIEIKGRWWWDGNGKLKYKNRLHKNLKKRQAVLCAGYQYEVWLFENRKNYRILKDDADFAS